MSTTVLEFLEDYIAQSVKLALKKYGRDDTFVVSNLEEAKSKGAYYSDHIGIILLWSGIGAITLKVHFSLETAKKLAGKVFEKPSDQILHDAAMDFMKELNNIVGGGLRGDFEKNKILVGMSLPFLTKGSDEAVFRQIRDPRTTCRIWKMGNGECELIVSTEICLLESKPIDAVRDSLQKEIDDRAKEDPNDSGDVDFL